MDDTHLTSFKVLGCCGRKYPFRNYDLVHKLIKEMSINEGQKEIILCRIERIYYKIYELQKIYKYSFFYSRVYVMIASIISPAITSINTNKEKSYYTLLWWITWNLQILISLITSISTFFKWDRNYFLYSEYKDNVEEEVWRYLECIGDYKKDISNNVSTHEYNLPKFFRKLETLYSNLCLKDTEIKLNTEYSNSENLSQKLIQYDIIEHTNNHVENKHSDNELNNENEKKDEENNEGPDV